VGAAGERLSSDVDTSLMLTSLLYVVKRQKVTELVGSKADLAGQVEQMKTRVERTQLKMGDLVDRVKLQQTELEVRLDV